MPTNEKEVPSSADPVSFVSSGTADTQGESAYNEFFQETGDGSIALGKKARKSSIEYLTTTLGWITPIVITLVTLGSLHVYIQKGGGARAIKENYTFLCPYLNYGIKLPSSEYHCETITSIKDIYTKKRTDMEEGIIEKLNEYIPIKLTKNVLLTSPERKFAETIYSKKLHMDEVVRRFEEIRTNAKSLIGDNITCNGISIMGDGNMTTQCTIYGSSSGNDDENGKLGSARIEALRFMSLLSDTAKSGFILLNPPNSLSMEKITDNRDFSNFETRTTLPIQAKYVQFTAK